MRGNIRVAKNKLYFILFSIYFQFSNLELGFSINVTTVTNCHTMILSQ